MSGSVEILRELHRLRQHSKNVQDQMDRLPRQVKAQQVKITKSEENLREAQESLKKFKVSIHQNEVSLKQTHQQINKYQNQLNESASKKEYDALQVEIANAKKETGRLEEAVLEAMGASEELTSRIPSLEKAVQQTKEECTRFEAEAKDRANRLTEELQRAQQTLKEVETTLPDAIRPDYMRLVAVRGEDALASVKNMTCAACYTSIRAQSYNDLLAGRLVVCQSCGRIQYLPASEGQQDSDED